MHDPNMLVCFPKKKKKNVHLEQELIKTQLICVFIPSLTWTQTRLELYLVKSTIKKGHIMQVYV